MGKPKCQVFISHNVNQHDQKWAKYLRKWLSSHGLKHCYVSSDIEANTTPGANFKRDIERHIDDCKYFVVLISPQVLNSKTDPTQVSVPWELDRAYDRNPRPIIVPIFTVGTPPIRESDLSTVKLEETRALFLSLNKAQSISVGSNTLDQELLRAFHIGSAPNIRSFGTTTVVIALIALILGMSRQGGLESDVGCKWAEPGEVQVQLRFGSFDESSSDSHLLFASSRATECVIKDEKGLPVTYAPGCLVNLASLPEDVTFYLKVNGHEVTQRARPSDGIVTLVEKDVERVE